MTLYLPKVAIIHGEGSASPLTIKAASLGLCQLVFLYSDCNKRDKAQLELLKKHVNVFDITSLTNLEVAAMLREEQVAGIVTFSEYQLPVVTKYCTMLGLIGHSDQTLACLTDKYLQRERLATSNVNVVRHAVVDRQRIEDAAERVGFPAVLKPRIGAGSRWTIRVSSIEELRHALSSCPLNCEYVLEEFLAGDKTLNNKFYGDYVSVESVHSGGKSQQICVTAKLPLTEHFAETGMFVPHPFSSELAKKILEVESKAIRAVGVTDGVTHTEIKITSNGPKIIEINGRVGGYVPEILKRAMGVDLVRAALQVSIGEKASIDVKPITSVIYQIFLDAPIGQPASFVGMIGMEEVERMDGVLHLEITKDVGQIIDYRLGTQSNLGVVYGIAPDFESFSKTIHDIKSTLVFKLYVQGGDEIDAR